MATPKTSDKGKPGMDMGEHNSMWRSFIKGVTWGSIVVGGVTAFLILVIVLHWNIIVAALAVAVAAGIAAYIFLPSGQSK